jgi:hypothetical protein|tara:strand:- start:9087 stop:9572 length:486 start_codon:yes stop_codon:yes gene_type:complete
MTVRRQAYQWIVEDVGQLPIKRLELLSQSPQSVFYSGIGNATIKARLHTKDTEYIVIKYFGSTPGIYGTGNDWVPAGYVNFSIGTTTYFKDPDGRPALGLSGSAAPFPVSTNFGPAFKSEFDIEIPPGTDWDVNYFMANAMVDLVELFPKSPDYAWSMIIS